MREEIKKLINCDLEFCIEHFGWNICKLHNNEYAVSFEGAIKQDEKWADGSHEEFSDVDKAIDYFLEQIEITTLDRGE